MMMKLEQLMTRQVKSSRASDTLNEAAQAMWEGDLGCVPVLGANDELVGIITDRDIAMAAYIQGKPLRDINVGDVMTRDVQLCKPGESVSHAEALMRRFQIRRLPVVDASGRLLGIVSMNDIALEAERERQRSARDVRLSEVALTLAQVSRHREQAPIVAAG